MTDKLSNYVLDNGLNALQGAKQFHLLNADPTTYGSVTTNTLANNSSPNNFINVPVAASPNGSLVVTNYISGGGVVAGEAHKWAFVDVTNSRLLANGHLDDASTPSNRYYTFAPFVGIPFAVHLGPGQIRIPSDGTDIIVSQWVLNNGLLGLVSAANAIYLLSNTPTTWTEALTTYNLGVKVLGAGSTVGAPSDWTNGRQVDSVAVTGGSITTSGTVTRWAIVDSVNSRLLVNGAVSPSAAATSGQNWALPAVTIRLSNI